MPLRSYLVQRWPAMSAIAIGNEDLIITVTAIQRDLAVYTESVRLVESIFAVRLYIPESPIAIGSWFMFL